MKLPSNHHLILLLLILFMTTAPRFCLSLPPDTLWSRFYQAGYASYSNDGLQTIDGGFVIASHGVGITNMMADVYLVRTDSMGDTIWTRTYGGFQADVPHSIAVTSDLGYILAGETDSYGDPSGDFYILRVDSNGDTLWTRSIGTQHQDRAECVIQDQAGDFLVTGHTDNMETYFHYIPLVKYDDYGDTLWTRSYDYLNCGGQGIIQDQNGDYVIAGICWPDNDESDGYLIKTNTEGDTIWTRIYEVILHNSFTDIKNTADGGYIIAGKMKTGPDDQYDFHLLKTDVDGDILWTCIFGGEGYEDAAAVQQTDDGGFIIIGRSDSFDPDGFHEVWMIKLDQEGTLVEGWEHFQPTGIELYPAYPNPFNAQTVIPFTLDRAGLVKLEIFNIVGRSVGAKGLSPLQAKYSAGNHEIIWKAEGLSSGVYLVRLDVVPAAENRHHANSAIQKIVLIR